MDATTGIPFFKNGIRQIALVVEDLDKAVEHYTKLLGIGPWEFYTYGKPLVKQMSYRGKPADYRMRIAFTQMGPMQIELIQPLSGENIYSDYVAEHGYRLHHIAVAVDDMESALAQAEAAGIAMIQDGKGFGVDGDGWYAYLDTEALLNTTLELLDVAKRRYPPEKIYPAATAGE